MQDHSDSWWEARPGLGQGQEEESQGGEDKVVPFEVELGSSLDVPMLGWTQEHKERRGFEGRE